MNKKVVIVTGGLGGIGLHITGTLAANGYKVYATYKNKSENEVDLLRKTFDNSENVICTHLDVTSLRDCQNFYTKVLQADKAIFGLINNAGITADSSFRKMTFDQWQSVINTNLHSLFNTTQIVFSNMLEQKNGCIINISSVNALKGQFGQANYCATKAGILGFTKALALEGAKSGVRVNAIAPGYTDTAMVRAVPEHILEEIKNSIPTRKLVEPSDIAYAVSFLLSDAAKAITGETLSINGGMVMY